MKFQFCSDLHLEFAKHSSYFQLFPILPQADILILAGDITYLREDFYLDPFFDYVSKNWQLVYWVPGNHEYYCGIDILSYDLSVPKPIRHNVFLLDNCTIDIGDIQLIFSTLWSKIDPAHQSFVEQHVSDFECIIYDGKKLDSKSFNLLHKASVNFMKNALAQNKSGKNLIVTHHLPSQKCNHPDYYGSKLNSAFVAEMDSFIKKCGALAWIYGHSHRNMPEIAIGETILLSNQFGYMAYNEHKSFNNNKVLNIK